MPRIFDDEYSTDGENFIGIALDRSGSMNYMIDPTINGFNEYVQTIQKEQRSGKTSKTSLVTFGGDVILEFRNRNADKVRPLTRGNYKPNGNTPLYKAINVLLDHLEEYDISSIPANFLVVILSDGEENASGYNEIERAKRRINSLKARTNWKFVYIGANQDVFEVHKQLDIPAVQWTYTTTGTRGVMRGLSSLTSSYLSDPQNISVASSFAESETYENNTISTPESKTSGDK